MAVPHGSKAKVYFDGYDLSAFFTSASAPTTVDVAEISAFGDTAKKYIVGLKDATFTAEGFYDSVANGEDAVISAALGASAQKLLSFYPNGDAIGNRAIGLKCDVTAYDATDVMDDAAKVTLTAQSSVGAEFGVSLHALGAETTPGQAASVDNAASSASGGAGYIQATAATGSATIKIQHSSDNVTFADLITFTAVTARTSERKTVTGTVNRYLRDDHTPGTTVTYATHFARG